MSCTAMSNEEALGGCTCDVKPNLMEPGLSESDWKTRHENGEKCSGCIGQQCACKAVLHAECGHAGGRCPWVFQENLAIEHSDGTREQTPRSEKMHRDCYMRNGTCVMCHKNRCASSKAPPEVRTS